MYNEAVVTETQETERYFKKTFLDYVPFGGRLHILCLMPGHKPIVGYLNNETIRTNNLTIEIRRPKVLTQRLASPVGLQTEDNQRLATPVISDPVFLNFDRDPDSKLLVIIWGGDRALHSALEIGRQLEINEFGDCTLVFGCNCGRVDHAEQIKQFLTMAPGLKTEFFTDCSGGLVLGHLFKLTEEFLS